MPRLTTGDARLPAVPAVDAVFLDIGNVLVFHDNQMLYDRLAALGGTSSAAVERALETVWDPCHRGQVAGDELRRAVSNATGRPLDPETFRRVWSCHLRVHEEVMPLVESMLGRAKMYLLSNTNAAHFEEVRSLLPVLEKFDGYVLSHELGVVKPDCAIFDEALRRSGVTAARAAYFDDLEPYVSASRAMGIQGYVFTDATKFRRDLTELGF